MDPFDSIDFRGQPALRLATADGARAVIALLGGQLLSWCPAGGSDWLFVSERASFDGSRAIRGGVPVCWPQFAAQGRLPRHGLLRTRRWTPTEQRGGKDFALATLRVEDDEASRAIWPFAFELELTVLIEGERLSIELEASNTGHGAFAFTGALHTYLRVTEVERIRLEGLARHSYRDGTRDGERRIDSGDHVRVEDHIDRIYTDVDGPLLLRDGSRSLAISAAGFTDVVVWNPWQQAAEELPDIAAGEFRRMLCVEAAVAGRAQELAAGESWVGRQTLVDLSLAARA
ncbi:MAG: D-hexose-6-phosphate mutarotase [Rhodocyclaceae bacterium]|nr:D-hexose-6-phosphate mutarotase [Rhodocyclaceae bacterium]